MVVTPKSHSDAWLDTWGGLAVTVFGKGPVAPLEAPPTVLLNVRVHLPWYDIVQVYPYTV